MSERQRAQTIEIRLAKPIHAESMARMSRRLIEIGLPWWCWTPKRVEKAIRSPDTIAIIARTGKKMSGFGLMYFGDESAHLNLLAVEPAYRRRRIGYDMVRWLEESCSVAGILSVSLEVRANNVAAIRFYQTLGYAKGELIPQYYCGQEAALRMTHRLAHIA